VAPRADVGAGEAAVAGVVGATEPGALERAAAGVPPGLDGVPGAGNGVATPATGAADVVVAAAVARRAGSDAALAAAGLEGDRLGVGAAGLATVLRTGAGSPAGRVSASWVRAAGRSGWAGPSMRRSGVGPADTRAADDPVVSGTEVAAVIVVSVARRNPAGAAGAASCAGEVSGD
jgi:hypothetical protein